MLKRKLQLKRDIKISMCLYVTVKHRVLALAVRSDQGDRSVSSDVTLAGS